MTIQIKYFASLRESIGRSSDELSIEGTVTVEEVWNQATQNTQRPENILVAVNQEYAHFDHPVKDGDEVAFFPPVTGG